MRTTTADPIIKTYTEGERAYLACSVKFKEIIDLTSINYSNDTCIHSERYAIGNLCNGKTDCSFDVSNSNIGSSCGANGTATLEVRYNCIRHGGWSDWITSASCPVTCGSALRNLTRTCSNPYPNEIGDACTGVAFDEQTCNTNMCMHQNTACWKTTVNWNCQDGHIIVHKAVWETGRTCGDGYFNFKSLNVIRGMKNTCEKRQNCSFIVNDHTFGESCSTANSRCTVLDYVYACGKATWNDWSSWSECTRSCGSGIQTRQRQCLNQMNTTDGYVTECEGIGTGSRSCNTELCPCRFGSGNSIGHYECIPTTTKPCPMSFKLNVPVNEGEIIDIDTLSNASDRMYALNYSTTINRPVSIVISSEPVTIPDHLTVDAFVMTIPISDPDYGDLILDFKLDYNNDYFYLDTKLS
ncbi:Hypothetical predicted protein [Mytilus galloprovincialis]|uniref:Uncharacterized protein n=1 Tax=Mytilus galloprovincialis TaxID=29158 RepID=A0A8B6E1X9_MYTGA|nr:Hypothetical predicted protein [Mytilus galloprovincialis]